MKKILLLMMLMLSLISCEDAGTVEKSLIQTIEADSYESKGEIKWTVSMAHLTPIQSRRLTGYLWMVNSSYFDYKTSHDNDENMKKTLIEGVLHLPLNEVTSRTWLNEKRTEPKELVLITETTEDKPFLVFDSKRYLEDKSFNYEELIFTIKHLIKNNISLEKQKALNYVGTEVYENEIVDVYALHANGDFIKNILSENHIEVSLIDDFSRFIGDEGIVLYFKINEQGYLREINGWVDLELTVQEYIDLMSVVSKNLGINLDSLSSDVVIHLTTYFNEKYLNYHEPKKLILPQLTEENTKYYSELKEGE